MSSVTSASTRVCVIGAGPCGLTTIKNLLAAGLNDVVCYEEGSAIGGNWVYDDDPERRSVYRATRLISSKRLSEFEDFPMPADYPDFRRRRFGSSPRHVIEVDYHDFRRALLRELGEHARPALT